MKTLFKKAFALDITELISKWWKTESMPAKYSFFYALIIGFVSHLFIYTGRYYGRDDMGTLMRGIGPITTGRWFNGRVINFFTSNYVLPLVYGLFVALFLAAAAFYVCKIFSVSKKSNAVIIGLLMSTFPSIANTNLYLYETATYHLAVLLAVAAVYVTINYKYGFICGAVLSMFVLGTYQSKINIVTALCLFYLLFLLLKNTDIKNIRKLIIRFALLLGLAGIMYAISLAVTMNYYGAAYNNHYGFSPGSMQSRLLTFSGLTGAVTDTYKTFYDGFFGRLYLIFPKLKYVYVLTALLSLFFTVIIIKDKKLYKQPLHTALLAVLALFIPLACNFSNMFAHESAYGLMIYSFVLLLVFCVVIAEQCNTEAKLFKSVFVLCMFFIIINYIVGNNIYYMRAHYQQQRTNSLTTRVLDRIEPLLPLTTSNTVTVYGALPNEYLLGGRDFGYPDGIQDGSAVGQSIFLNYNMPPSLRLSIGLFGFNINNNHGVLLKMLTSGEQWEDIRVKVLDINMPVWPAEGSVGIIDDVIVVNFGIADVKHISDETGQYFLARHWVSRGHMEHTYEYRWKVYVNDALADEYVTDTNRLDYPAQNTGDKCTITVDIVNTTQNYRYTGISYEIMPGSHDIVD